MFNFFKKSSVNKKIPAEYTHLINQQEYEAMLGIALQYFKEKGEAVTAVENGYIATKEEGEKGLNLKYGLDNLVRAIAGMPPQDWESIIYTHFNKFNYDIRPLNYFKKDYEEAKQYLKVLIKDDVVLKQEGGKDVVHKIIIPGTCCVLVLDYDNKFTYLQTGTIAEWNKTTDELFEEAFSNLANEQVEIYTINFEKEGEDDRGEEDAAEEAEVEGADVYLFMHGDFAAPMVISLEEKAPFAMGEYGAIVAIPAKGTALAAPINDGGILKRLDVLTKLALKDFEEKPGHITPSLYWYYNNMFEIFPEAPSKDKEGYITVSVPHKLSQLVNEA